MLVIEKKFSKVCSVLFALLFSTTAVGESVEEFALGVASSYSDGFAVAVEPSIQVKEIANGQYLVGFSLEGFGGGNSHTSYLSLIASTDGEHLFEPSQNWRLIDVLKVGRRGWRLFEFDSVVLLSESRFLFDTKIYQPSDAMCCPSGSNTVEIKIANEMLWEQDK